MIVRIGIAKTNKYAVFVSGDSVDLTERPRGGISVIIADGQGSGNAAKLVSSMLVGKAVSLILDGVRDGAVARAAHDFLYSIRGGKVSATLTIVSVDLFTKTIVISRNGHNPVFIKDRLERKCIDLPSSPIGIHKNIRPDIDEIPLRKGIIIVTFTDGISTAGKRIKKQISWQQIWEIIDNNEPKDAQNIADSILKLAIELDQGRPSDDMSVLVLCVDEEEDDKVRRLQVSFPC